MALPIELSNVLESLSHQLALFGQRAKAAGQEFADVRVVQDTRLGSSTFTLEVSYVKKPKIKGVLTAQAPVSVAGVKRIRELPVEVPVPVLDPVPSVAAPLPLFLPAPPAPVKDTACVAMGMRNERCKSDIAPGFGSALHMCRHHMHSFSQSLFDAETLRGCFELYLFVRNALPPGKTLVAARHSALATLLYGLPMLPWSDKLEFFVADTNWVDPEWDAWVKGTVDTPESGFIVKPTSFDGTHLNEFCVTHASCPPQGWKFRRAAPHLIFTIGVPAWAQGHELNAAFLTNGDKLQACLSNVQDILTASYFAAPMTELLPKLCPGGKPLSSFNIVGYPFRGISSFFVSRVKPTLEALDLEVLSDAVFDLEVYDIGKSMTPKGLKQTFDLLSVLQPGTIEADYVLASTSRAAVRHIARLYDAEKRVIAAAVVKFVRVSFPGARSEKTAMNRMTARGVQGAMFTAAYTYDQVDGDLPILVCYVDTLMSNQRGAGAALLNHILSTSSLFFTEDYSRGLLVLEAMTDSLMDWYSDQGLFPLNTTVSGLRYMARSMERPAKERMLDVSLPSVAAPTPSVLSPWVASFMASYVRQEKQFRDAFDRLVGLDGDSLYFQLTRDAEAMVAVHVATLSWIKETYSTQGAGAFPLPSTSLLFQETWKNVMRNVKTLLRSHPSPTFEFSDSFYAERIHKVQALQPAFTVTIKSNVLTGTRR